MERNLHLARKVLKDAMLEEKGIAVDNVAPMNNPLAPVVNEYTRPLQLLRHLPVEFWTEEGLSMVASGVGRPLYSDAITKACTRLDFACICVMLNYNSKLPKHIVAMQPTEDGGETPCKVDIEYEWIPSRCTSCCCLGHSAKQCPTTKVLIRPPVSIYVPRPKPPMDVSKQKQVHMPPMPQAVDERVGDLWSLDMMCIRIKAKLSWCINSFQALDEFILDDDVEIS
ncbi:UNVERIFIED_CONTAM: hypothetical protein Sangu_2591600 [Sesamum angustifolium]|uniref:Zinc knuckle CX2CX4HX4C domain-containing protein n=1 Tax=Sesamum angustifolium TaxID=2727405 RepID=A0AAW2J7R9_9LAMI